MSSLTLLRLTVPYLAYGTELGKLKLLVERLEHYLHRHVATHILRLATHYIAQHLNPFRQFHHRYHIRKVSNKSRRGIALHHCVGIHGTFPRRLNPLHIIRKTFGQAIRG